MLFGAPWPVTPALDIKNSYTRGYLSKVEAPAGVRRHSARTLWELREAYLMRITTATGNGTVDGLTFSAVDGRPTAVSSGHLQSYLRVRRRR